MKSIIEKVREHFEADKYLMMTGVEIIEVGDNSCVCSLKINPDLHYNAGGVVQGGVIYTLADSAFAVASNINYINNDEPFIMVNQSAYISYMKAGSGETLTVHAKKIGGGKKIASFQMDITDDNCNIIATMIGNGYSVPINK